MPNLREWRSEIKKKKVGSDRGDSGSNWRRLQEAGTWYNFYDWRKEINYFV